MPSGGNPSLPSGGEPGGAEGGTAASVAGATQTGGVAGTPPSTGGTTGGDGGSPAQGGETAMGGGGATGMGGRAGSGGEGAMGGSTPTGGSSGAAGTGGEEPAAGAGGTGGGSASECNSETAVGKVEHTVQKSIKSDDCVELVINPQWASVNVTIEGAPGTEGYPIPFSYSLCGGKGGSGELKADFQKETLHKGDNPGCNVFVQFEGTGTTLKLVYYD